MRYAIYIPLNAKDLTIELAIVAYGNQGNAIKFARANHSDLLRALKHSLEVTYASKYLISKVHSSSTITVKDTKL